LLTYRHREQTIQVNTLSTTLLGLLLLDYMKQKREYRMEPSHLIFVTSRDHLDPDITAWAEQSTQKGGLLQYFSDGKNWPIGDLNPNYANSKLMLTYAVEQLCERAVGPDGKYGIALPPKFLCPPRLDPTNNDLFNLVSMS
jgi:hypothetical protein